LAGTVTGEASDTVRLSLAECLDRALLENMNLRVQRYTPPLAAEEVEAARAAFDPVLEVGANLSESRSAAAASELDGSAQPTSERSSGRASVAQRLPWGTQLQLAASQSESETDSSFSTLNPAVDSTVDLSINQPLLRGGGRAINTAAIQRGRIAVAKADHALRAAVMDLGRDTELGYWALALAHERRAVATRSLALSEQLLAETQEMVRQGVKTQVEALQAEADVAAKREAVVVAGQRVADAEDRLWWLMGSLHEHQDSRIALEPVPDPEGEAPDEEATYQRASRLRPELQILAEQMRERELDLSLAARDKMPSLDLSGRGGFSGRAGDRSDAVDGMLDRDGYAWQADLTFRIPWGLREGEARMRQAGLRLLQEQLSTDGAEEQLLLDVRAGCRAVRTGLERVRVTRLAESLTEQQLGQEQARFDAGLATVREVMDAQDDVDSARVRTLEAISDTIEARVRLARLEGSWLLQHGLSLKEAWDKDPGEDGREP
jgi:outer membrane protein TolC